MDAGVISQVAQKVSPNVAPPAAKAPGALGQTDFMKLLIAQMKQQDPLNPQDPTQFTAQLAQFSSLEQLTNINSSLSGLGTLNGLNQQLMATSAIGKKATIDGNSVNVAGGIATPVNYTIAAGSATTTLQVLDSTGKTIAQVDLGSQTTGSHTATWNGLDTQGRVVPDGDYEFKVAAADSTGGAISTQTGTVGVVTGVTFDNTGQPMLEINGQSYSMSQISKLETA